jgi:predicted transcriptional regulator
MAGTNVTQRKKGQFAMIPRTLFFFKLSGSAAWQVLGVLLSYADVDGTQARPKIKTIVEDTGLSRRAVYSAIKELEERGLLDRQYRRKDGRQASNLYTIHKNQSAPHGTSRVQQRCTLRPDPRPDHSDNTDVLSASASPPMGKEKKQVFDLIVKLVSWERGEQGARSLAALLCREYAAGDVLGDLDDFVAETTGQIRVEEIMSYFSSPYGPIVGPKRKYA